MLPIDVTFDTGKETESRWKQNKKDIVKDIKCSNSRGTVDKRQRYGGQVSLQ